MAIKFVVARYENDNFDKFLKNSIEKYEHVFVWNDEADSIFKKYNIGVDKLIEKGLDGQDIVCFCHADVKILDEDFEEKVSYAFKKIPMLGVAGVIGATELHETCGWWLSDQSFHRGHLIQWQDKDEKNKYHMKRTEGNYTDCCVVDGLIMFTLGHIATNLRWDEETYPQSYDMYDYDYCLSVMGHGYKVAVLDILVEHGSAGEGVNQERWRINKERFVKKWNTIGLTFPIKVSRK